MTGNTIHEIQSYIIKDLIKINEEFQHLESWLNTNSLISYSYSTRQFGFFRKKTKSNLIYSPNKELVNWIKQKVTLIISEYERLFQEASQLREHGEGIISNITYFKELSSQITTHLHAFSKAEIQYFKKLSPTTSQITIHKAERILYNALCDLRIAKEQFFENYSKFLISSPQ